MRDRKAERLVFGEHLARLAASSRREPCKRGQGGEDHEHDERRAERDAEPSHVVRMTLPVLLPPATPPSACGASASGTRAEMCGLIFPASYSSRRARDAGGMSCGARVV